MFVGHDVCGVTRFKLLPHWPATAEGLQAAAAAGTTAAAVAAAAGPGHQALNGSSTTPQQQQQQQQSAFTQDGVYFRHTAGHYALGGSSSPLALLWKDESCSRYLVVSVRAL
jgi:hypothetical protein